MSRLITTNLKAILRHPLFVYYNVVTDNIFIQYGLTNPEIDAQFGIFYVGEL